MKRVKIALAVLCAVACFISMAFVPMTVNTVSAEDVPTTLTEIYPENFGITDGLHDSTAYLKHTGSSLLGAVFSMDFRHLYGEEVWFYYASSEDWYGINFMFRNGTLTLSESGQGDKTILGTAITFDPAKAGVSSFYDEVRMQISLEAVDNDADGANDDLKCGIFFNGKLYDDTYIYANDRVERVGNGIYINNAPKGPVSLYEISKPDDSKTPFEVTPADFGIADGTVNKAATLDMGLSDKQLVTNATLNVGQYITYAGLKVERTASGKLTVLDTAANNAVTADVADGEFELKITTNAKNDSTVKATVTVNGKYVTSADVANSDTATLTVNGTVKSPKKVVSYGAEALNFAGLGLPTGDISNASAEVAVSSGEKVFSADASFQNSGNINYHLLGSTSILTFKDFGIADGEYHRNNTVSGQFDGTLDKSVFMATVMFTNTQSKFYFGGKSANTGIYFQLNTTEGLRIMDAAGTKIGSIKPKDAIGTTTFNKNQFDLAIGTVVDGQNVKFYIYINDVLQGTYTAKDFANDLGNYVTLTSTSTYPIAVSSTVHDIDFTGTVFEVKEEILTATLSNKDGKFAVCVGDVNIDTDTNADSEFAYDISLKPVALDNDGVKNDMVLTVYVENEAYGNKYYFIKNCIKNPESNGLTVSAEAASVKVFNRLPEDDLEATAIYSLEEKDKDGNIRPFLLTACGDYSVNRSINYKIGDTITTPGEYVIVRNVDGKEYVEKVALWKTGYTNNDEVINLLDFIAMYKYNTADIESDFVRKGGDLDFDGNLTAKDIAYMKRILLGLDTVPEYTYERDKWSFEENVMPISGFYGPTTSKNGDLNTDKVFKLIADAGINHLSYTVKSAANREQNLIYGDKYGIGITTFISVPEMDDDDYAELVGRFSHHKSFKGLFVWDEPTVSNMSTYAAKSVKANSYSNLYGYTNLFPSGYSSEAQVGSDYQAYLDEYCATYNPKMISWDHYVFNAGSSQRWNRYFANLSTIRNTAQREGIPFWAFLQLGDPEGINGNNLSHTKAETLWNANTQLAYGAKGIQYFPLVQPYDYAHSSTKTDYNISGMISANGEKNKYYDYVVDTNRQIVAVDEILMNSDSKDILANQNASSITGISKSAYGSIKSFSNTKGSSSFLSSNQGVIIGCFDYLGKEAYYVVNNDRSYSTTVTINFDATHSYTTYNADATVTGSSSTYSNTLAAGAAVLIVLD